MKYLLNAALVLAILFITGTALPQPAFAAEKAQSAAKTDFRLLEGQWGRLDGGYMLELRDIKENGSVKAAYANPSRRINVFTAKWSRKKGKLTVFVELRDINYPGSKYNLWYDPASDRLEGTYYQAVEKQTYDIEFIRIK